MTRRGQEGSVSVPARPVIEIMLDERGRGSVDGRPVPIDDPDDPQASLLAEAVRQAAKLSRPVRVRALDPDGVWHLAAHPDGTVTELAEEAPPDEVVPPPADADTSWHLRVHPNGEIVALDDDDPDEEVDHVPGPAAAGTPPVPAPSRSPDAVLHATAADVEADAFDPGPDPIDEAGTEPDAEPEAELDAALDAGQEPLDTVEPGAAPDGGAPDALAPLVVGPAGIEPEPFGPEILDLESLGAEATAEPGTAPEAEPGTYADAGPGTAQAEQFEAAAEAAEEAAGIEPDVPEADAAEPGFELEFDPAPGPEAAAPEPEPEPVAAQPEGIVPWLNAPTLLGRDEPGAARTAEPAPATDVPLAELDLDDPDGRRDGAALLGHLRSGAPTGPTPRRRATRWIRPAAVVGAGVLVVGALSYALVEREGPAPAAVAQASDRASTTGTASAPASGSHGSAAADVPPAGVPAPSTVRPPATLAAAPPPGFRNAPAWAVPISSAATSLVSADGRVLTLTADNQVALVDPQTGRIRWHAPAPRGATGPHLARIDGKDVAAVMTADRLTYWPLPAAGSADRVAAGAATSVDLPPGTAVSWAGPSPLLVLGDGAAAVVRDRTIQRANLPTGMKPLAADGADVLAWSGRSWIRQGAGQGAGTPKTLAPPEGATGTAPIRVENVGGSFLGTMWEGSAGPVVAVYDAHGGAMVVHTVFPKDVDFSRAPTVREIGSERTVVGSALFEPAQYNLSILSSTFTPVAITPGHVFADDVSGVVADLQIKGKDLKVVPFKGKNPIVPVGIATAPAPVAVVAAPHGNGWLLCGLPAG